MLTAPINTQTFPINLALTEITLEFWFKADDVNTLTNDVIVGATPYKIRKQAGFPKIQLFYSNNFQFCPSKNLTSNTWDHFAFTSSKTKIDLYCYINGVSYSI